MANLNPLASGSKTTSGISSLTVVIIGVLVTALLKQIGIVDADGQITATIVSLVIGGGLTAWGAIHKWIKSRKK
jgi:hypothetical protein